MICSICGNNIDFPVQLSIVSATGRIVSQSTCTSCSRFRHCVFFVDSADVEPRELADLLTSVSEFIGANGRPPTLGDIPELIALPTVFTAQFGTDRFTKQLQYLHDVVDFIKRTDRIPLIEEFGVWP